MLILIVQNRVNRRWSYGPTMLQRVLQYDSDGGEYATASKAKAAAYADSSIPRPVTFQSDPAPGQQEQSTC